MSTTIAGGAALPHHRSVSNIKSSLPGEPGGGSGGGTGPRTPLRTIPSNFGSPASLRAEEDVVVIEFGARKLQVGFAGDAAPRGRVWFGPEQQRRVGDFRAWESAAGEDWRRRVVRRSWSGDYELWQPDLRGQDLGLVSDRIERALREAYTKHMLIDSRPRRMVCVLPSGLPTPLLSTVLDTLFHRFQPPTVALLSSPVMMAVAAGVRSALVVDLGWSETVVTSIYEYREVQCSRTVRGGRMLVEQTHKFLAQLLAQARGQQYEEGKEQEDAPDGEHVLSFEECEEIASRLVWCKPASHSATAAASAAAAAAAAMTMATAVAATATIAPPQSPEGPLPTVHEDEEQDESSEQPQSAPPAPAPAPEPALAPAPVPPPPPSTVTIRLQSCTRPTTLEIPYERLVEPCEAAFFGTPQQQQQEENQQQQNQRQDQDQDQNQDRPPNHYRPRNFDDDEQPLANLVYAALLRLPLDVRATCMARVIFTGGGARVIGLRARIFDEVDRLVRTHGWDPVCGRAVAQLRANPKLKRRRGAGGGVGRTGRGSRLAGDGPVLAPAANGGGGLDAGGQEEFEEDQEDGVWHDAANAGPEPDPIEEQLRRNASGGGYRGGAHNHHNNLPPPPPPPLLGKLRALESLGAWGGASLAAQLRVPAVASVDRDIWLAQGAAGASRPNEVDFKPQQRQSLAAGGLMRSAASGSSWTLGIWGNA